MNFRSFRAAGALSLLLFFVVSACSSGSSSSVVAQAELASGCLIDSDCRSPLVCAFKTCHVQCATSDGGSSTPDCPSGEICVASDRPYQVCQTIQTCTYNSDCPSPLVCGRDLECRDQCASARDCVDGQLCIDGTCIATSDPDYVDGGLASKTATTTTPEGEPCAYNSDCPDPLVCRSGLCEYDCKADRDCSQGETCIANLCVTPGTIVDASAGNDATTTTMNDAGMDATTVNAMDATIQDGGTYISPVPDGAPAGYEAACILNSDCARIESDLVCTDGRCVYQCVNNFDCNAAQGACCSSHVCVTGSVCIVDASTTRDSAAPVDAGAEAGPACSDDGDCNDGNFCDGVGACISGHCANYTNPCDDRDPCTTDTCDPNARTCGHTATGPIDQDHDGHYATSCGTGGDDCDDTNADVYPGHAELCDGLDNNCNGVVDEGVWNFGATVTPPYLDGGTRGRRRCSFQATERSICSCRKTISPATTPSPPGNCRRPTCRRSSAPHSEARRDCKRAASSVAIARVI
jgi:hypothetical protein